MPWCVSREAACGVSRSHPSRRASPTPRKKPPLHVLFRQSESVLLLPGRPGWRRRGERLGVDVVVAGRGVVLANDGRRIDGERPEMVQAAADALAVAAAVLARPSLMTCSIASRRRLTRSIICQRGPIPRACFHRWRSPTLVILRPSQRWPCLPTSFTVLAWGPFLPASSTNVTSVPICRRSKASCRTLWRWK